MVSVAAALVQAGGTFISKEGFVSVSHPSTGVYVFILVNMIGLDECVVAPTERGAVPVGVTWSYELAPDQQTLTLRSRDTGGSPADVEFSVAVWRFVEV